jgi:arsenite-transporting ATPase
MLQEWEAVVRYRPTGQPAAGTALTGEIDVKVFTSVDTVRRCCAKARQGIEMMSDPEQSTFAFVMYPESTPILEAWRAAQELGTVGVHPGLVVANMVIPPEHTTTPFVQSRRVMQEKYLKEIAQRFSVPLVQIPLLPNEIKGLKMLTELGEQMYDMEKVTV